MELTMAEKRDIVDRVTERLKFNVLNRENWDDIFRICLAACNREMEKIFRSFLC